MQTARARHLPQLREDISLYPGPTADNGSPTWSLHDPAANRYYRIGWLEFELLSRWNLGNTAAIAAAMAAETTLRPTPTDIETFIHHLTHNHLLQPHTSQDRERVLYVQEHQHRRWWQWLLQNYLFIRLPLWHPDPFLQRTLPTIRWMFTGWFATSIGIMALLGLGFLLRQWESFSTTFLHFYSLTGLLYYAGILLVTKIIHELGHAYTARHFGCRVPIMGVMFLVFWPMLYTETSEAWKLTCRRQRLAIDMAGMVAELGLAALATLAWSFLPEGPMKSAAFLLASSLWIVSLAINLNPFMRFDGYFILSDLLEVANLQGRAFAYSRWQLREWLFGFGMAPPEHFPRGRQRFMVIFALGTWIYRLFLFVGIALLVYHFFFKLLGLFLFVVEIIWFIFRPMGQEIMAWYQHRSAFRPNMTLARTLLLLCGILLWLALPWPHVTTAPALLQARQHTSLYTPSAAQITHIYVQPGQNVKQGDLLLLLESPDLHYRLQTITDAIALMRWQLSVQEMASYPLEQDRVLQQKLETLQYQQHTIQTELEKLNITAPFSGNVVDLADDLTPGEWLAKDQQLLTLIDAGQPMVTAYWAEADVRLVPNHAMATFYPENPDALPQSGRLLGMDQTTTHYLPEPYMASIYGGNVPVRLDQNDRLVVEGSFYRSELILEQVFPMSHISRGLLSIKTSPESHLNRLWYMMHAIFIRESGF